METDSVEIIVKHFPKIVEKACELAEKGDTKAMKLILDRVLPMRKATSEEKAGSGGVTIIVQGRDEPKKIDVVDGEFEEVKEDVRETSRPTN